MKIKQDTQLIVFKKPADAAFTFPVVPASQALPDWYKKTKIDTEGNEGKPWEAATFKACMPMFDAMTQGYIIPLWSDIYVQTIVDEHTGEDGMQFIWPKGAKEEVVSSHGPDQTQGLPIMETASLGVEHSNAFKFANPWLIETPKGYSTLFVSPLNNANPNFEVLSAIVATDSYKQFINFPFVWKGPKEWAGTIPQGTPLVQLIPFKREDFRHEIGTITKVDEKDILSTETEIGRIFRGAYKRLWRKIIRSM